MKRPSLTVTFSLLILTLLALGNLFITFKLTIFFCVTIAIIILLSTKNLLLTSVLIAIFTFPILSPNKIYPVVVLQRATSFDVLSSDYIQSYGLFLPNIFIFLTFLSQLTYLKHPKLVARKKYAISLSILLAGYFIFFVTGLLTSTNHAPNLAMSLTWLIQYLQVFPVAWGIFTLYITTSKKFPLIYLALSFSLLLESIIVFWQFFKQGSIGLFIEAKLSSALPSNIDANTALFRPAGTLLYPNETALVLLIQLIFLYPYLAKTKNKLLFAVSLIATLAIILTQSRTIWLMLGVSSLIVLFRHHKHIAQTILLIGVKRLLLFVTLIVTGLSYVLIPRLLLINNIYSEGGAIPTRIEMIKEGIEAFFQSPLLGFGIGTNEYVLSSLFPDGVMHYFPAAIHMAFLQLALEVGIVGLIAFILPIWYLSRAILIYSIKSHISNNATAFFLGIITFGGYYSFHPHVGIFEFSYLGLIIGLGLNSIYEHDTNNKKGP